MLIILDSKRAVTGDNGTGGPQSIAPGIVNPEMSSGLLLQNLTPGGMNPVISSGGINPVVSSGGMNTGIAPSGVGQTPISGMAQIPTPGGTADMNVTPGTSQQVAQNTSSIPGQAATSFLQGSNPQRSIYKPNLKPTSK